MSEFGILVNCVFLAVSHAIFVVVVIVKGLKSKSKSQK